MQYNSIISEYDIHKCSYDSVLFSLRNYCSQWRSQPNNLRDVSESRGLVDVPRVCKCPRVRGYPACSWVSRVFVDVPRFRECLACSSGVFQNAELVQLYHTHKRATATTHQYDYPHQCPYDHNPVNDIRKESFGDSRQSVISIFEQHHRWS